MPRGFQRLQPEGHLHFIPFSCHQRLPLQLAWTGDTRFSFEYDPRKAAANLRKPGVSFEEGLTFFEDPLAFKLLGAQHSAEECCLITVGLSARNRILFVIYSERGSRIRLIGARLANAMERQQYEEVS